MAWAKQWWIALLSVLAGGFSPAHAALTEYPFQLITRQLGADYQVEAENNGPAPITVHVTVTGQNFALDRKWPATAVVPPHTTLPLGRIYANARGASAFSFLCNYSYHFGRADSVHDSDAAYRLPFENGRGFWVSQAYGGVLTTHGNRENQYAVDFAMPEGSAVTAARGGVVADVTMRFSEGGDDIRYRDMANKVEIVHDDGTVAEYAHLSPGPALVAAGQRVAAGTLLGYSGSTGYASGPHLHFSVSRPVASEGKVVRESVSVLFYSSDSAMRFAARAGTIVYANYGRVTNVQTARASASAN